MPFMHKIKVIVSWMRLEKIMCYIINILSGIPFLGLWYKINEKA